MPWDQGNIYDLDKHFCTKDWGPLFFTSRAAAESNSGVSALLRPLAILTTLSMLTAYYHIISHIGMVLKVNFYFCKMFINYPN